MIIPQYNIIFYPIETENLQGKTLILKHHSSTSPYIRDNLRRAVDGFGCNPGAVTAKIYAVRLTFGGRAATIIEMYRRSDFKGWVEEEEVKRLLAWEEQAEKNLMWNILKKE